MVLAHRERLTRKRDPGRPGRRSGCASTPSTASTPARCRRPASSPGTTRSTPRRCCPTAPPPSLGLAGAGRPRHGALRAGRRRRRGRSASVEAATQARRRRAAPTAAEEDEPRRPSYIVLSAILFTIGCVGVLVRRNAHRGVHVRRADAQRLATSRWSTFARQHGNLDGQIAAFFVMVVAAAEVVVGLAIIMTIFRTRRSASVDDASLLKY